MKSVIVKKYFRLFLSGVLLASCGNATQQENTADTTAGATGRVQDTVLYNYTTLAKMEVNDKVKDTANLYRVNITYPVITGSGVLTDSINSTIRMAMFNNKSSAAIFADSFTTRPKDLNNKIPVNNAWTYDASMYVILNNEKLFVLEGNIYAYTGGAHGLTTKLYYNLDKNGKQLQWNDIMDTTNKAQLMAISETTLRMVKKIPDNQTWADAGFFIDSAHLPLPATFGFDKTGLIMTYNQYEVTPYSMGIISYTIPYDQLRGIIKEEWLQ